MEAEDDKNLEELGFVPSAVSEPRWALHICDKKCRATSFKFFGIVAVVTEKGRAAHTTNLYRNCYSERRAQSRGKRCEVEGAGRPEVFPRQVMGSFR